MWMYATLEDDAYGELDEYINMVKEHFDVVFYKDIQNNPKLGEKVSGIVEAGKKHCLEQLHLMPNLKVGK